MKHPLQVSKWKKLITSSRITPSLLTMQALLSDVIVLAYSGMYVHTLLMSGDMMLKSNAILISKTSTYLSILSS